MHLLAKYNQNTTHCIRLPHILCNDNQLVETDALTIPEANIQASPHDRNPHKAPTKRNQSIGGRRNLLKIKSS